MKNIKDNILTPGFLYVIGLTIIFISLFYWFQIRPVNIKSHCHTKAVDHAIRNYKKENPYSKEVGVYSMSYYEKGYKSCLRSRGL